MGIPGLFASLIKEHNNEEIKIINKQINNNLTNHLYLDFNCAIYQVVKPELKTPESLIIYIVEYLETLCKIIPDVSFIYIAIDGVVNAGKQKQQRDRRFHSICKKNRINKINQTYGSNIDKTFINNELDMNMVSPGTSFMYDLAFEIKKILKNSPIFRNKKVIFSDSSLPGEGEHKILQHIRLSKHLAIDGNESERFLFGTEHNTIIYGLDNDLIILSLGCHQPNTYLFREANEYGNFATIYEGKKFLFMDIDELSKAIIKSFNKYCKMLDSQNIHRYIDDYVFISMILGNDFMPKNHWYSIYEGGLDKILSCYFQIHNHTEEFLVNNTTLQINTEMLGDIWYLIKAGEYDAVCKLFEKRKKARVFIKPEMSERERQQLISDFYPLQHLYVEQAIEPTKPLWQSRYYKICFNNMEYTPDNTAMVCQAYLKTLVWNYLYYNMDECPSWDWVYPYSYSPLFSDIYDELVKHKNINTSGSGSGSGSSSASNRVFNFKKSEPIDQQTLLFMVLPKASHKLIVKDIARKLIEPQCPMNIYFPKTYGLNVAFHRYYYECTPIICKMDIDKVRKFVKECKFTEDELRRNLVGDLFIMG